MFIVASDVIVVDDNVVLSWHADAVNFANVGNCRIDLGTGGSGAAGSNRVSVLHTKNLDVNSEGLIVDMTYFDSGNLIVIISASLWYWLWEIRGIIEGNNSNRGSNVPSVRILVVDIVRTRLSNCLRYIPVSAF